MTPCTSTHLKELFAYVSAGHAPPDGPSRAVGCTVSSPDRGGFPP
ncbi:hypothetical protein T261_08969 [Streptomyces lydicus]|nr:hypothetical protein T261_00045 [Streptomyces lydicus]AQY20687.1 hypothetical protein T261_08969 [Streptomyces lydicus]